MRNEQKVFVAAHLPPDRHRLAMGMVILLMMGRSTWAQAGADSLDRSLDFVDKTAKATELFNTQHNEEALALFQELASSYADLDEDGYAALGIGDCLAGMGKYEQARQAYTDLLAKRADLQPKIEERMLEAELLSGTIGQDTLARLRQGAKTAQADDMFKNRVRLGWALEKQALALLSEAVDVFRAAAPMGWYRQSNETSRQMLLLDELKQDLASVVAQTDAIYGARALPPSKIAPPAHKSEIQTDRWRAEYILRAADGKRYEVVVRPDESAGHEEVAVNGKTLVLTEDEQQIIQRHQDRINAILLQAANRPHGQ